MFSDKKEVIERVKNMGVAIGTQIIHIHHIFHGIDHASLIKGQHMTQYAYFLWNTHTTEDIIDMVPDIGIRRIAEVTGLIDVKKMNQEQKETINNMHLGGDIDTLNHDYLATMDSIEKVSCGHALDVNEKKADLVISHTDKSELVHDSSTSDIEFVLDELHTITTDDLDERKAFEERIRTVTDNFSL